MEGEDRLEDKPPYHTSCIDYFVFTRWRQYSRWWRFQISGRLWYFGLCHCCAAVLVTVKTEYTITTTTTTAYYLQLCIWQHCAVVFVIAETESNQCCQQSGRRQLRHHVPC